MHHTGRGVVEKHDGEGGGGVDSGGGRGTGGGKWGGAGGRRGIEEMTEGRGGEGQGGTWVEHNKKIMIRGLGLNIMIPIFLQLRSTRLVVAVVSYTSRAILGHSAPLPDLMVFLFIYYYDDFPTCLGIGPRHVLWWSF